MTDPNAAPHEDDEFFVGYFPTPPGQRLFLSAVVVAMLLLTAGVAYGTTQFQRHPGRTQAQRAELAGLLLIDPVPMLRFVDEESGEVRSVLLSGGSKRGIGRRLEARAGEAVTLTGPFRTREGGTLMEVYRSAEAELDEATMARLQDVPVEALGEVTVSGELIDSKCWYGAMHPGGGPTHRACAQLCLFGGVPPVLITHDASGHHTRYALASATGGEVHREMMPFAAQAVEITGELERHGDMLVLRVAPERVVRR